MSKLAVACLLIALAWLTLPVLVALSQYLSPIFIPITYSKYPPATATPGPARVLISEIVFDPNVDEPNQEWIEIFNAGGTVLGLAEYKVGDEETRGGTEGMYKFPPGAKINPGEVLVIANFAAAFKAVFGTDPDFEIRESNPSVPNLQKYTNWSTGNMILENNGDDLLLLDPTDHIADALSWGNSYFAFYPSAPKVKEGHSLERYPATLDTNNASDWKDRAVPDPGRVTISLPTPTPTSTPTITLTPTPTSTNTLTPTATTVPALRLLLISEVLYDPTGLEPQAEWIEIYNPSDHQVALTGYKIGDEETSGGGEGMFEFPSGVTLQAGKVLLIAHTGSEFIARYGFRPDFELAESDPDIPNLQIYLPWGGGPLNLGNIQDEVLLLDTNSVVVDALSWGDSTWAFDPACPDVIEGHSLERRPANVDTDRALDWMDQSQPAPGQVTIEN